MMSCIVTVVGHKISVNNCYQTSKTSVAMLPTIIVSKIALQERGVYESHKIFLLLETENGIIIEKNDQSIPWKTSYNLVLFTTRSKALKTA